MFLSYKYVAPGESVDFDQLFEKYFINSDTTAKADFYPGHIVKPSQKCGGFSLSLKRRNPTTGFELKLHSPPQKCGGFLLT